MASRKTKARKQKEYPLSDQMSNEELLKAFETLVSALKMNLRYEKGDFKSGSCRVEDKKLIILQKKDTTENKILALARLLKNVDLNRVYVIPTVWEIINGISDQQAADEPVSLEGE